jgi:hypothetical protein
MFTKLTILTSNNNEFQERIFHDVEKMCHCLQDITDTADIIFIEKIHDVVGKSTKITDATKLSYGELLMS